MLEMQTPLIVMGARLPQDFKMDYSVMRYDIAPTMVQLLHLTAPDAWRGKSVLRGVK
jgi:arylsulfatase A-like enzyme